MLWVYKTARNTHLTRDCHSFKTRYFDKPRDQINKYDNNLTNVKTTFRTSFVSIGLLAEPIDKVDIITNITIHSRSCHRSSLYNWVVISFSAAYQIITIPRVLPQNQSACNIFALYQYFLWLFKVEQLKLCVFKGAFGLVAMADLGFWLASDQHPWSLRWHDVREPVGCSLFHSSGKTAIWQVMLSERSHQ